MPYTFLADTYETECLKVVSVWSEFEDDDFEVRPRMGDVRGRSVREQMVHQCVSEDAWFRNMLGVDVAAPPLPREETRLAFITRYPKMPPGVWPSCDARLTRGGKEKPASSTCGDRGRGS